MKVTITLEIEPDEGMGWNTAKEILDSVDTALEDAGMDNGCYYQLTITKVEE